MAVLRNRAFWIGAVVGIVGYMFVWPMVSGALRSAKGDG